MITVNVGQPGGLYHKMGDVLFGPFAEDGTPLFDSVRFRHSSDSIRNFPDITFGEKDVIHTQHKGTFHFNEMTQSAKVVSGSGPYTLSIRTRFVSGRYQIVYLVFGHANTSMVYHLNSGDSTCFSQISHDKVVKYETSNRHRSTASKTIYTLNEFNREDVTFHTSSVTALIDPLRGREFSSPGELMQFVEKSLADDRFEKNTMTDTRTSSRFYSRDRYEGGFNIQKAKSILSNYQLSLSESVLTSDSLKLLDYGELAKRAVEKLDAVDTNLIAFTKDLKDIKSLKIKLNNLRKLKTHASNHLAVNYGILPTIDDLKAIVGAFSKAHTYDRDGRKLVYSADVKTYSPNGPSSRLLATSTRRIKIAIRSQDSRSGSLLESLENWGFGLNFSNLWDLIPYSFVLDWFIDIGDLLESVDSSIRLQRLPIEYVTRSDKLEITRLFDSKTWVTPGLVGSLTRVNYIRTSGEDVPLPVLSLDTTPKIQNHWIEAGALIIQRK